eukprot:TRINITY_DN642_c0_g1_i1.p1 TRINITY_DN642_c0_g1~~TRINITY_DN642_c0_g1_i1.p1  ORF type:complete len:189 (+),score=35.66 TRINITY_DN642_c0_g1_i1:628-1194(+)
MDGSTRYCRICLLEKPDRAHHCSSCGRCVLKMDHHCVWVGGCVGFCNYKYFFLFIMYIGITGIIGSLLMMRGIFETASSDDSGESGADVAIMMNAMMQLVFGITLLLFTLFHLKMVLSNQTTIEIMEKKRNRIALHGSNFNPFDLGWRENFRQVFGVRPWQWFLPTRKSCYGDGITFPRRSRNGEENL